MKTEAISEDPALGIARRVLEPGEACALPVGPRSRFALLIAADLRMWPGELAAAAAREGA